MSLEAKELRIGNKAIYVITGEIITVTISWIKKAGDRLKPIPLTEEWLLKFGFQLNDNVARFRALVIYKQDGIWWFDIVLNSVEIKHVHQLQNLYYALTNKELTIKQ
ncbi:MAG: hypothetical protein COB83_07160 [Gammaproteobacteria bacterium]|nr:MAG: hypothetical protein COB83_07160 [Gammaproteobacteria bacterium]